MAKQGIRSEAEIEALLAGYEALGQTRRAYCQATGLAVTTLDSYRVRQSRPTKILRKALRDLAEVFNNGGMAKPGMQSEDRKAKGGRKCQSHSNSAQRS